MTELIPIQVDANTVIYMEAMPGVAAPESQATSETSGELTRGDLNLGAKGGVTDAVQKVTQSFDVLEMKVKTCTEHTLRAFNNMALGTVDRVKLEFGVNVGGEAGVPYVTKGTAECSLKITVECSFPDNAD